MSGGKLGTTKVMADRSERWRYNSVDEWRELELEYRGGDKMSVGSSLAECGTAKTSGERLVNTLVRLRKLVVLKVM